MERVLPPDLVHCGAWRWTARATFCVASPANVVTTPPGVIFRIVLCSESETWILSALSTATPIGRVNRAVLPTPSLVPFRPAFPANVVTTPSVVTFRMVLYQKSATKSMGQRTEVLTPRDLVCLMA